MSNRQGSEPYRENQPFDESQKVVNHLVQVQSGAVRLDGNLQIPENPKGLVIFVHGSGSSRNSPRNQYIADQLNTAGLAALLFDLFTLEEEEEDLRTRHLRFNIDLLAQRTVAAAGWLSQQPLTRDLRQGFFGASTGAAAALMAAAEMPERTAAVVSRGGRPDLAGRMLFQVKAPTLFIVGQFDEQVIQLNKQALEQIDADSQKEMVIVPNATHLFEEPGALENVGRLAKDWFGRFLGNDAKTRNKD